MCVSVFSSTPSKAEEQHSVLKSVRLLHASLPLCLSVRPSLPLFSYLSVRLSTTHENHCIQKAYVPPHPPPPIHPNNASTAYTESEKETGKREVRTKGSREGGTQRTTGALLFSLSTTTTAAGVGSRLSPANKAVFEVEGILQKGGCDRVFSWANNVFSNLHPAQDQSLGRKCVQLIRKNIENFFFFPFFFFLSRSVFLLLLLLLLFFSFFFL